MEWTSELQALASRNRFIDDLLKLGFDVAFVNAHLVIFGVPCLDGAGNLQHLDLITPLDLREQYLIDRPSDHKMWIAGALPHNLDGSRVAAGVGQEPRKVSEEISANNFLSNKPPRGHYESIEEKVRQYLDLIVPPALEKFRDASPLRALRKQMESTISPLIFPDSLSARDGVLELSHRLLKLKVAIVGCGGTGAYMLDFLAKTHIEQIHLYDDDIVHVHTLFRLPGVYGERHLGSMKVDALSDVYGKFHRGIRPHVERISEANLGSLSAFDYVFVSVDDGPSRRLICRACDNSNVPFVDVGMGLNKGSNGLYGFVRTAGGERGDFPKLDGTSYLPHENPIDHEYRRQPQIAELNALNASMAVIRFKQHIGFFDRATDTPARVFDTLTLDVDPRA
jgi:molybdopterin/thiamine biosynthesis adenylyltransferase